MHVSLKKLLKILVGSIMFTVFSFIILPCLYEVYAEELYFDKDGNLVHCVAERRAISTTKYKTIGWTLKKYDDEINIPGQVSTRISKSYVSYSIIDEKNPEFVLTYVIIPKKEIISAIEKVSPSWAEMLDRYGGEIYFDGIFTVMEKDVPQGFLDENNNPSGEVYFECEGITNARGWRDAEAFKNFFNVEVKLPFLQAKPDPAIVVTNVIKENICGSNIVSNTCGSHKPGKEEYDIDKGIPSGEDLYVCGYADRYYYEGILNKTYAKITYPITVNSTFILEWTDRKGVQREKTVTVTDYVVRTRNFLYYAAENIDIYNLTKAEVSGDGIESCTQNINVEKVCQKVNKYKTEEHYELTGDLVINNVTKIVSSNYFPPDIPIVDVEKTADTADISLKVRNDSIQVGTEVVLSDEYYEYTDERKANLPIFATEKKEEIYMENVCIKEKTKNMELNNLLVSYTYESGEKQKIFSDRLDRVNVHTPVYCDAKVISPKKYNMSVNPKNNQVVLGSNCRISFTSLGNHLNIYGYGMRDYSEYAGKIAICAEFPIVIGKTRYDKGTWIIKEGTITDIVIPKDVKVGTYKIHVAALANNCTDADTYEELVLMGLTEEKANLDRNHYCATSTIEVEVIGTMYGFNINNTHFVGNRMGFDNYIPKDATCMPFTYDVNKGYEISIYSNGFGTNDTDSIKADIKYYVLEDGERKEVDVYRKTDRNLLGVNEFIKATDSIIWTNENKIMTEENVYMWKTHIDEFGSIVVMPKGIKPDNEQTVREYAVRNKMIVANSDIKGFAVEMCENSYLNVENFRKGYCNMWKTEGYKNEYITDDGKKVVLEDGDFAIISLPEQIFGDYEVVGTH